MSIKLYNEKRNFKDTPEPAGKVAQGANKALLFVIQKHEASHLHYDFRLELEGVMKSWAVPKGPSLNPDEKRLAMHVEDHPMTYRTFEGIIPKGNYGAGTVMVWDEGTYYADPKLDKKANEKVLIEGYRKGRLSFHLKGKKLQGEFSLVRMRGKSAKDNAWLLLKANDAYADSTHDIRDKDTSAASRRSMEQIAGNSKPDVRISNRQAGSKETSSKKTVEVKKPHAVKKARTLKQASTPLRVASPAKEPAAPRKKKAQGLARTAIDSGGKKTALPKISGPQLATLVDTPFDREGWAFEIKWDGYRALGFHPANDGISLLSRNNHSFDDRFPAIRDALTTLPFSAIVDGEVVVLDEQGKSSFGKLQSSADYGANLFYYLFDLLYVDGVDVRGLPLRDRKQLLQKLLEDCDGRLRYSDHVETHGIAFFEAAKLGDLEGILAKDLAATYQTGSRTRHWLKIKIEQRQEFIIAGYTKPRRSRSDIGSLVLGYYGTAGKFAGKLRFAGHVGSGMDTRMRAELKQKLDPIAQAKSPFTDPVATNEVATWVKPQLVCEVRYTEKTSDCQLRHPVFLGLRTDKRAKDIHWDRAQETRSVSIRADEIAAIPEKPMARQSPTAIPESAKAGKNQTSAKAAKARPKVAVKVATEGLSSGKSARDSAKKKSSSKTRTKRVYSTEDNAAEDERTGAPKRTIATRAAAGTNANAPVVSEQTFAREAPERNRLSLAIGDKKVAVSHPKRMYFPELKLSKLDVIDFYRGIAPYLLPYLKDRPFVLHRFPAGIYQNAFYQKDNDQELPDWVQSTEIRSESTGEDINYILCQNEATLVYLVNLGCIEMHPWNSRIRHIDKPDWLIFDLDPVDIGFARVVEVAQAIHSIFEPSGIPHYCKTSGKRGLHIAVPLGAKYPNNTVREMAQAIAQLVHHELPGITSLERSPAKRRKKVYLDYLQNGIGKTLAAPYSLRPVDYAGISAPLHWEEVTSKLDPRDFNIHTIMDRLKSEGDIWQNVLKESIDLQALLSSR